MYKLIALAGLASLGWLTALTLGPQGSQERPFEAEALRLLEDRSQPWWNKHRPPKNAKPVSYMMTPNDDLGGREDAPIYTAQMPVELAAWLRSGGKPAEGHPFHGRPLVLLDVRRRTEHLAERIPGSLNIPAREFDASLESGPLSKLDRNSIIVLFGSRWPHFEIVGKLRGPKGFDALYAMGGLEAWKAKQGVIERDDKLVEFLKAVEAEKKASAPPPPPPDVPQHSGIDSHALKKLLDAGTDLLCIFVGDRHTYEDGHVPGAHHYMVPELEKHMAGVDKNQLIVVMCGCCMGKRGGPSESALHILGRLGFTRVLHLDGHMAAWKVAGFPVEFDDPPPRKPKR